MTDETQSQAESTEGRGEASELLSELVCGECGHDMKYHTVYGCHGAFPDGLDGISPDEVFYGECHCNVKP
jgi:hypothetical protein